MELRQYQKSAIIKIGDLYRSGKKRVVLYSPTGSGKTEIGMDIIKRAIEKNKRVIFVCNRIELVIQTSRRISESGIAHGIIQGANTAGIYERVQVCSIQSLDRRGYPEADIIIIDEAHGTAGSKSYQRMMQYYGDKIILGLTATPFSKGMAKVYPWGQMWESIASAATIRELIDLGYLVDCDIYAPSEPDLSKVKIVAGDYHEGQLGEAVDKPKLIGDIVLHWKRLSDGKPTICFGTNIAHSKHIVEQFISIGVTAEHVDCYTSEDERRNILARFNAGATMILSNVGIFCEGWDSPKCETMILARPTRSLIRYIQMCGRVLRPFEGKEVALILDHSGTCVRLGFPTDDLPLMLCDGEPKTASEKQKAEEEKAEKLPVLCPSCSAVTINTMSICPCCGHELPRKKSKVRNADGDLIKVKRVKGLLKETPIADRVQTYAELKGYAAQRGFKSGWAWHKCRELYGSAPRDEPAPAVPGDVTLRLVKYLNIKHARGNANVSP